MRTLEVCLIFLLSFLSSLCQAQQDELTDFPKRIEITIEDPTQLASQRQMFADLEAPQLLALRRVPQKERLWRLPPITVPTKFEPTPESSAKRFLIWLTAYPSFPESLFYNVLLAKEFDRTNGLIAFDHQTSKNQRTKDRGTYELNNASGDMGFRIGGASDLRFNMSYKTKNLGWLDSKGQVIRRDLGLWDFSSVLKHQISSEGSENSEFHWSAIFSGSNLKVGSDSEARRLNFRAEANAIWPFLNPIDFGGSLEYLSVKLSSATREVADLKIYVKDNFISFSPFVLSSGLELAALPMHDEQKATERTKIFFNPSLSLLTEVGSHVKLELGAERSVLRRRLEQLYFYQDFSELNPFLEVEREWQGKATLKLEYGHRFSAVIGAFREIVDGLTVYQRSNDKILSWNPVNLNAKIDSIRVGVESVQLKGFSFNSFFSHEFQRGGFEMIPYRPQDRLEASLSYPTDAGFEIGMESEYVGKRAKDTLATSLLPSYFLWKPHLSKSFGEAVRFFLRGVLSAGTYQVRDGYELPQQFLDAGFTVKF